MPLFTLRRKRYLIALTALSLSACNPPNQAPVGPSPQPSASTVPEPQPSPAATDGRLTVRLQADAALTNFATQQTGPFALCLSRIASARTRVSFAGSLPEASAASLRAAGVSIEAANGQTTLSLSRALRLADLIAGIEFSLAALPAGGIDGRSTFFDAENQELGFVSWQAELAGDSTVSVRLSPAAGASPGPCPQLEATVSGASLRGAGGSLSPGQALPNPAGSPSATPPSSPPDQAAAPGAPLNLQVVEQTADSLVLQWDFHPEARSHKLYLDGKLVAEGHVTPNYYRFEGLQPSTSYRLGVQSVNAAGESEIVSLSTSTVSKGRTASGNFSGGGGGGGSRPRQSPSPEPESEVILVNTETSGYQSDSDIARNPTDGSFVVVWETEDIEGLDQIRARSFNADGSPASSEILVTSSTMIENFNPSVGMDQNGDYVVAWAEYDYDGQTYSYGIKAQRYSFAGQTDGSQIEVTPFTTIDYNAPDVAMSASGDFVIVWEEDEDLIHGQLYDENNSLGTVFEITVTGSEVYAPAVAMDAAGDFVVVWEAYDTGTAVQGQRFNALGTPTDAQFTVATTDVEDPDVAMNAADNFVVTWADDSGDEIFARHYRSGDEGSAFSVREAGTLDVAVPTVAMDSDGDYAITWSEYVYGGPPDYDYDGNIYVQRYASNDQASGEPFTVNTDTDSDDGINTFLPRIAIGPDGVLKITWTEGDESEDDHDIYVGIFSED